MGSPVAIEAIAEVRQVKTMADYTVTVSLNFPESCKEQAKKFIDWVGLIVRIVAVQEDIEKQWRTIDAVQGRAERKSKRATT